MSVRRRWFVLCASLVVLGSASMIPSQAAEAPNRSVVPAASPGVIADPAQPPQGLSSTAWGKIMRQVRASRYDLSRRAVTVGDAGGALAGEEAKTRCGWRPIPT